MNRIALALLLETHRDSLLDTWAGRVLADPNLPSAAVLSRPALYDHFPEIVDLLVAALRTLAEDPEDLGRLVGDTEEAQSQVRRRIEAEYSMPELLRELSHLRFAIVEVCDNVLPDCRSGAILHSAFDQMMVNAGDELSRLALYGGVASHASTQRSTDLNVVDDANATVASNTKRSVLVVEDDTAIALELKSCYATRDTPFRSPTTARRR